MGDILDPRPSWLHLEDPSVFDSPMIRGLRAVTQFFGYDDPDAALMGTGLMAKIPKNWGGWEGLSKATAGKLKSLAKLVPQEHMDEVLNTSTLYREAMDAGDPVAKEYGKRLAELDRIGRTGAPYRSSDPRRISGGGTIEPSKTISNARLQDELATRKYLDRALKRNVKK